MLINFTSGVFKSEKEMELYKFRWNEARSKYLADLQANGLIRWASMQIWNKQGKSQLGWLFEYSDPDAYKKMPTNLQTNGSRFWRYRNAH